MGISRPGPFRYRRASEHHRHQRAVGFPTQAGTGSIMRQGLSSRDGASPASWASVGISGHQWASVGVTFPAQGGAFRCRRASEHHGHQSARSFPVQAGKRASWASVRCGFPTQAGTGSIMSIIGAGPLQQRWGLSSIMGISGRDLSGTGGSFQGQAGKRASWASVGQVLSGTGGQASIIGISALWLPNPSRDGEHHEHHWGRASPAEMGPFQHHGHQSA